MTFWIPSQEHSLVLQNNKLLTRTHGQVLQRCAGISKLIRLSYSRSLNNNKMSYICCSVLGFYTGYLAYLNHLCDQYICQRVNSKMNIAMPELHPIPVVSPWYHLGIDVLGPFYIYTHPKQGSILTIADYFSTFVLQAILCRTK